MKMIDRNGRIFGKISVIDLVVVAVVVVLAAALYFKSNQAHTGSAVEEQTITFQVRVRGLDRYIADAVLVGDGLYDQNYPSGGRAIGYITEVEVERDPGTKLAESLGDGTAALVEAEDTVDLLITLEGKGLVGGERPVQHQPNRWPGREFRPDLLHKAGPVCRLGGEYFLRRRP